MRFSVSPTHVHVLTRNGFYVTVAGYGVGWLRCLGVRRWVFGNFYEKFLIPNPATTPVRVVVRGVGIGGVFQATASVEARFALHAPLVLKTARSRSPLALPNTRRLRVSAPSLRALGSRLTARWNEFAKTQS